MQRSYIHRLTWSVIIAIFAGVCFTSTTDAKTADTWIAKVVSVQGNVQAK